MSEPGMREMIESQGDWLTVHEVAQLLRLSEEHVRDLIRQRKIRAAKLRGWMVRPEDLEVFVRSRMNIAPEQEL